MQNTFLTNDSVISQSSPGKKLPLDEIILEDFTQENGWYLEGAMIEYGESGGVISLIQETARLSKTFEYSTWKYSDLAVQIRRITEGCIWGLTVRATQGSSTTIVLQSESNASNSKFGESFIYSLKGIAGADPLSNWNAPLLQSKSFELSFVFQGSRGQMITLGSLKCSEPDYAIPQALPSNVSGKKGHMDFEGSALINVDELKNDDPVNSSNLKEFRNLSLPFSRLVTNPEYNFDNQQITPIESSMDLRFGAYYGIRGNANKTMLDGVALREKKSGFQDSTFNALLSIDGVQASPASITSAWYPHKVELSGQVPELGKFSVLDFFIDENSIGRIIDVSGYSGTFFEIEIRDSTLSVSDYNSNNLKSSWNEDNGVVIKTDTQHDDWNTNLFLTAIKVVALTEDGTIDSEATSQIVNPNFNDGSGKYQIPLSISKVGLVVGYATREEGLQVAIERALSGVGIGDDTVSITEAYQLRKNYWEQLLARVPVPETWGVTDSEIYHQEVASPEKHRLLYYSGWVHLISNILAPTPETGYAHTQQSLGKGSRQCAGAAMTPANNCWEGLLQIQDLMYINPSVAWSGMEGFMSMVDANGYLSGEVLPVRMAQTLWMIHSVSPDLERLAALYPALKRHIDWKIKNPRWVYETINVENEIDSEFMISVLYDVKFLMDICEALGGDYISEKEYWQMVYEENMSNYALWMFCDPYSHEALYSYPQNTTNPDVNRKVMKNGAGLPDANYQRGIWQYIFVDCIDIDLNNNDVRKFIHAKNEHLSQPAVERETTDLPHMICSGLVLSELPEAQSKQLEQFALDIIQADLSLAGFPILKWGPSSLFMYGLINRGFDDEAKTLLDSYIVRGIEIWQFCENYFWNASGPKGTYPTSFGASQVIDCTFMKNGVMNDGTGIKELSNWF